MPETLLRSSQARNGSLLECTTTGPAVSYLNLSAAFFCQESALKLSNNREPSADHSSSALSAACLPAGRFTLTNLPVVRSQIIGSNVALLSTNMARRLPSGDHF